MRLYEPRTETGAWLLSIGTGALALTAMRLALIPFAAGPIDPQALLPGPGDVTALLVCALQGWLRWRFPPPPAP